MLIILSEDQNAVGDGLIVRNHSAFGLSVIVLISNIEYYILGHVFLNYIPI